MRYSSLIRNQKALEWELSLQEAYLFSWMYELPSWAEKVVIGSDVYYFASKNKAIEEMPLLTTKADTMYRYYKSLESKDLILIKKIDGKDYISLTQKSKTWNFQSDYSENNPTLLGNKSEYYSENNPTYNNTNFNKTTNNNNFENFQFSESEKENISLTDLKKCKEKSSAKKESDGLHKKMIEAYYQWYNNRNGVPPKIDAQSGKAMKELIAYFKTVARSKNQVIDDSEIDEKVLEIFNYILNQWHNLDSFLVKQIKLSQINSNIANIIEYLKNGKNQRNNQSQSQQSAIDKAKEAMAIVRERDRIRNGYSTTE